MENFVSSFKCHNARFVAYENCIHYTLHIMTSLFCIQFLFYKSIPLPFSLFWMLSWTFGLCEFWIRNTKLIVVQFEQFDTMRYSCYCHFLIIFQFDIYIEQRTCIHFYAINNSSCLIYFYYKSITLYCLAMDLAIQNDFCVFCIVIR